MTLYVGIDPSLSRTAVVWVDGSGTWQRCDEIETSPSDFASDAVRLDHMETRLRAALEDEQRPALIAVEGYAYNADAAREKLGEWGGVLRVALYRLGMTYTVVAPATLKKFATGKGNGPKDGMRMHALKRFGFESRNNDECDAYCLGRWAAAYVGELGARAGLTKPQLETLSPKGRLVVTGRRASELTGGTK